MVVKYFKRSWIAEIERLAVASSADGLKVG
jgi:hypothetical protein